MISLVRRAILAFIVALFVGFYGCAGFTSREVSEEPVADSNNHGPNHSRAFR